MQADDKHVITCDAAGTIRIWDFYIPVLAPESAVGQEDVIAAQVIHEEDLQSSM